MSNSLLKHLNAMTPAERVVFAEKAESSPMSLRLAANGYKTNGKLAITPEFAARIEKASDGKLSRVELSETCAKCPFSALGCVTP